MSGRVIGEYLELTKPRITLFILMSAAIGFFLRRASGR
jgi:heme O synthase-like polyprenyltransferase